MLCELLPRIEKTKDLVQGISVASGEQSLGAGQVNGAVQQLDKVIQRNAAGSVNPYSVCRIDFARSTSFRGRRPR